MSIKIRSGGQWVPVSGGGGEPVGTILMWAGSSSTIPNDYLLCDGSAISRSTYSALFSAIGTTNGVGDGSSTFNIPNLVDKFVVGASSGTGDTTYPGVSPAATGGSATATLPSHYHNFPGDDQLEHAGSQTEFWTDTEDDNFNYDATSTLSGGGKIWRTSTAGSSATNANLPPYYSLCYLIKVFNTRATITGGNSGNLTVQNGGTNLTTTAEVLNFGSGITASGSGANITLTSTAVSPNLTQNIVTFNAGSTTYTPTTGTKYITVYGIGGGGGGSSASRLQGDENQDSRGFGGAGGGSYGIASYNITGSFTGNVVIGAGGQGGADPSTGQMFGGSTGGSTTFQPVGSYTGSAGLSIPGGNGGAAGSGGGAGGGATPSGTNIIGFAGESGESNQGNGGEHQTQLAGRGGFGGQGDPTYGKGASGRSGASEGAGGNGTDGLMYIFEYIST